MERHIRGRVGWVLGLAAVVLLAGCRDETTAPDTSGGQGTLVTDLDGGTAYIELGDDARVVTPSDPSTSTAWDLALSGFQVSLNGGVAGAGNVSGYCVCDNADLSNEELRSLTAESELVTFEAFGASDLPAASAFEEDALVPAISGWYLDQAGSGAVAVPDSTWILRSGGASPRFSKFRVVGLAGSSASSPGKVSFEHTTHAEGATSFDPVSTTELDLSGGSVYFNMSDGIVTAADDWDLHFDGWQILTNGGVSGNGGVMVAPAGDYPFDDIDYAFAASVPPVVYETDTYGGVFSSRPWYRYNLTGTDHQVWPTYDIYLIRRGSEVFKVQFINYYDAAGKSGVVTMRYARVSD